MTDSVAFTNIHLKTTARFYEVLSGIVAVTVTCVAVWDFKYITVDAYFVQGVQIIIKQCFVWDQLKDEGEADTFLPMFYVAAKSFWAVYLFIIWFYLNHMPAVKHS